MLRRCGWCISVDCMNLDATLAAVAATPRLLVVSDYDGTLAEFNTDAYAVSTNPTAERALKELAALPDTEVAILSGRHTEGLKQVTGFDETDLILAGSHGAESNIGKIRALTAEQQAVLDQITTTFEELAAQVEGAFVEYKPYHRVLHLIRATDESKAAEIYERASHADIPGAHLKPGKWIVEGAAIDMTKGTWITIARKQLGATAVIFVGDDRTDEDGFAVLGPGDLSVKVGPGDTKAQYRVPDVSGAGEFFAQLVAARRANGGAGVEGHV